MSLVHGRTGLTGCRRTSSNGCSQKSLEAVCTSSKHFQDPTGFQTGASHKSELSDEELSSVGTSERILEIYEFHIFIKYFELFTRDEEWICK